MSAQGLQAPTIGSALSQATARLKAAGVEQPNRDARVLLAHASDLTVERIIGYPEQPLSAAQQQAFELAVARRARREPVARILGRREFWSLSFRVTADTLDPRPESECLVAAVLGRLAGRDGSLKILDLGTGTGCLLLALLAELPNAEGLGIDLLAGAVDTARENARSLGLAERASFRQGNWAEEISGAWQVIVSNPPYIKEPDVAKLAPEVALYDPRPALAGGLDGLAAYRQVVPQAVRLLAPGGLVAFEVGAGQAADVERLLRAAGFEAAAREQDLAGIERCVLAQG